VSEIEIVIPKRAYLPCYFHLIKDDPEIDIDLLFGGRDSGKSRFVAQRLVQKCLEAPYFRCVLARKVFATIKDSQWQLIKDVVEAWGLGHLFTFKVSPLEIVCANGNKFVCRGFDEPQKIKSLTDASDAWVEEGNQVDQDDLIMLLTTLRTNKAKVKTWITFNPEAETPEFSDFWLYRAFYDDVPDSYANFRHAWRIPAGEDTEVRYNYRSTWTTYRDNPWVTPSRKALLEYMGKLDPYYYKVFTQGRWGNRQVGDPFCYAFDREKHVGDTRHNPSLETVLSFDFNVNPITCGVYQHWEDRAGRRVIRVVESIKLGNSDIYKLCDRLWASYSHANLLVTGDATGKNTTALAMDGVNYYTVIKEKLRLAPSQIKAPPANPKVAENRVLVNAVFSQADVLMDPVRCKELVFDCQNVSVNDVGEIDKGDRANPKKRADHLDHFRYYLNSFHKRILRS
jgi:PBSX family phage terminase large subunit